MREITWPSAARVLSVDLRIAIPGQIIHDIAYSGQQKIFDTGSGLFEGSVTFALAERDSDVHRQMEVFFAAMGAARNWTALPIRRPTIPQIVTIDSLQGTGFYRADAVLPSGFEVGQYFTADDKLYVVTELPTGSNPQSFRCEPDFLIPDGTLIRPTTTVRASGTGGSPMTPLTPSFAGPWVWSWRERS